MARTKDLIKSMLGTMGLEVRRMGRRSIGTFPSDPIEAQRRLLTGSGRKQPTIFDVGANLGQTVRRYRRAFPESNIYCFEPFPDSIAALAKLHGTDSRVHIVPKAVGLEPGKATFYVNSQDATNSLLPRPSSARRYFPSASRPCATIEVDVIDLDGFVRESGMSQVDILKFDIQGGELRGLHGAATLLHAQRVALIYAEIMFVPHYEGAPLFHEISTLLDRHGYSLFDVYDLHRAANGQLRYGDALFVSESIRRDVIDSAPPEP